MPSMKSQKIRYETFIFYQSIRFTFDGQRVTGADTAASLGLEEGDTIEVFQVLSIFLIFVHIINIFWFLQEQQGGTASG